MSKNNQSYQPITLTTKLGKGGEATIYHIAEQSDLVAKIYHNPTPAREAKLRAMLLNPPEQPATHVAIAWPVALLYQQDSQIYAVVPNGINKLDTTNIGQFVGFLMPKVIDAVSVFHVYNPIMRANLPYRFDRLALHHTAYNLCVVIQAIHAKGYVIGDINESNILVNQQALVTIVDCDSFQVTDEHGHIHRCQVGKPEYTPPELQGVKFTEVDQHSEHDLFGMGVLLFQLLMNEFHPFAGVLKSQASVGRVDLYAIRHGIFPYSNISAALPPPSAPPLTNLHPTIQALFNDCFVEGYAKSQRRPTAQMWAQRLQQAEQALVHCKAGHLYSNHLNTCPYCQPKQAVEADQQFKGHNLSSEVLELMARTIQAYERTDAEKVLKLAQTIIKTEQPPAEIYMYQAWAYLQQLTYQAAIDSCREALQRSPRLAWAYHLQGLAHFGMGDYQPGINNFSQAIKQGHQPLAEAYYQRSKCYEALGHIKKAKADLNRILALDADSIWCDTVEEEIALLAKDKANELPVPTKVPSGVSVQEAKGELHINLSAPLHQKLLAGIGLLLLLLLYSLFGVGIGWFGVLAILSIGWLGVLAIFSNGCFILIGMVIMMTLLYLTYLGLGLLLNRVCITLTDDLLQVIDAPFIYWHKPKPIEQSRASIQRLWCEREIFNDESGTETFELHTNHKCLILEHQHYDQLRYTEWLLRDRLGLPDVLESGDYAPTNQAIAYDYKPIREFGWAELENGLTPFFFLGLLPLCLSGFILVPMLQETRLLDLSPHYTEGIVTDKRISHGRSSTSYIIEYDYIAELPDGRQVMFSDQDSVSEGIYNRVDTRTRIVYAGDDPSISRVAANFSARSDYAMGGPLLFLFLLGPGFVILFGIAHLQGMWYIQQIDLQGRIMQGVVINKKHRTWTNRGGQQHAYDVYYRYYGYEATFDSKEAYHKLRVGQPIKVGYLPKEPHISKPYY